MKMYNLCTGGHSVVTTAVLSSAVRPNSPSGKFRYTQGNTNTSTYFFINSNPENISKLTKSALQGLFLPSSRQIVR